MWLLKTSIKEPDQIMSQNLGNLRKTTPSCGIQYSHIKIRSCFIFTYTQLKAGHKSLIQIDILFKHSTTTRLSQSVMREQKPRRDHVVDRRPVLLPVTEPYCQH